MKCTEELLSLLQWLWPVEQTAQLATQIGYCSHEKKKYCIVVQMTENFFARIGKGAGENGTKISRLPALFAFFASLPIRRNWEFCCATHAGTTGNRQGTSDAVQNLLFFFLKCCELQGLLCPIVNCRKGAAGILFQYNGCVLLVQSILTELAFGSLENYMSATIWHKYVTTSGCMFPKWKIGFRDPDDVKRAVNTGLNCWYQFMHHLIHNPKVKKPTRMQMERGSLWPNWRAISFFVLQILSRSRAKELGQITMDLLDQANWQIASLHTKTWPDCR